MTPSAAGRTWPNWSCPDSGRTPLNPDLLFQPVLAPVVGAATETGRSRFRSDSDPHCKSITARSTQVRDDTVIRDEHTDFRYRLGLCSAGPNTEPGPTFIRNWKPLSALHAACRQVKAQPTTRHLQPKLLDVVVYIHVADRLFVFGFFGDAGFVTVRHDMPQTPVARQPPY